MKNENRGGNLRVSFIRYVELEYDGMVIRMGPKRAITVSWCHRTIHNLVWDNFTFSHTWREYQL